MAFTNPLIYPEYALSILLALAVGALFPVMQEIRLPHLRRQYILLQLITLLGAIIGCKVAVLYGELGWPFGQSPNWATVLISGRSILGALIFGFLSAEIAKPILGYPLPPNDRFAAVLPFTFAIGRVGCLLHGCCRGIPYDGWCAIRYGDGIWRHAAPAYEMIFDLAIGTLFIWMVHRRLARGKLFLIFLISYGLFRFATEFVRETPKLYGGVLSGYQVLACIAALLGVMGWIRQTSSARQFSVASAEPQPSRGFSNAG